MLKIFAKLIVLPVMVILIALSFTVSILSKIHYLAAVLVNAIFIMCAVIALSLQQWQNFGIAVFVLAVSCMILKLWDIIEYAIGVHIAGFNGHQGHIPRTCRAILSGHFY